MRRRDLRVGRTVRVKSEREILLTLDERGTLEGLPFTQEMRCFCGKSLQVLKVINRIHISGVGTRSINNTVILEDARCGGEAHAECGRGCYLLFKTKWLCFPTSHNEALGDLNDGRAFVKNQEPWFWKQGVQPCQSNGAVLVKATSRLPALDIRQYLEDFRFGTWRIRDTACMLLFVLNRRWGAKEPIWELSLGERSFKDLIRMAVLVFKQTARWHLDRSWRTFLQGAKAKPITKSQRPLAEPLDLEPGDLVEVKSKKEIFITLDGREKHRGLRFYGPMINDCGKRFRVLKRVHSVVDEMTGKKINNIKDTVLLEGSICTGISYRGCPRACYWLWREDWLKKIG